MAIFLSNRTKLFTNLKMIAYIEGKLLALWDKNCIIVSNDGVGYEMGLSATALASLPPIGEKCALYLSLVAREDALELYGFQDLEEKRAFEILTGISKVGARTALAILSVFQAQDLCQMATCGDYQPLTTVSGIGNKTAQHIFLELKYKMAPLGKTTGPQPVAAKSSPMADAVAALVNLGYGEEEASQVTRKILEEEADLDLSALIRSALKNLSKGKIQ